MNAGERLQEIVKVLRRRGVDLWGALQKRRRLVLLCHLSQPIILACCARDRGGQHRWKQGLW